MTLLQVLDWLDTNIPSIAACSAAGSIDGGKDKCVGVYRGKPTGKQRICLGGITQTRYQQMPITILIHWTKSAFEAEAKAQEIYDALYGLSDCWMGGSHVFSVDPGAGIVPIGKDDNGIVEYVIRAVILYEKLYGEHSHNQLSRFAHKELALHSHKALSRGGL